MIDSWLPGFVGDARVITGDALDVLRSLDADSVQCCVTSPPYWGLRDYGIDGQLGLEETPEEYVEKLVVVFREVWRVMRDDGTLWLNLGDSYASSRGEGSVPGEGGQRNRESFRRDRAIVIPDRSRVQGLKSKDLVGIPWRVAFALQADGWYLRSDIIWSKPNPMPESVTDRPTKAHEYLFLLTKSARYFYDAASIAEPATGRAPGNVGPHKYSDAYKLSDSEHHRTAAGLERIREGVEFRNRRTVWTIPTQPYPEAHFATFPPALVEPCILAGSKAGDVVLDPFAGAGTVGIVATPLKRDFIGIDLNPEYAAMARQRMGLMRARKK